MKARSVVVPALLALLLVCTQSLRADHIVVGKTAYPNARLQTLAGGKLQFKTAEGRQVTAWVGDVSLIIMDKEGAFADFNQAERFMNDNQPGEAIGRYRRAQKMREDFWSDLIAARQLVAADRAGQLGEAVQCFIRVIRSDLIGPMAALRLLPDNISADRNAETTHAIQTLDSAIAVDPPVDQRVALELLRYEVLRRSNNPRASAAARSLCNAAVPKGVDVDRPWNIQRLAIEQTWKDATSTTVLSNIERALRDCPESVLPDYLLLKGRFLLKSATSREEIIRATWPIMRIVIHTPNHPRAADALFEAAAALERLGQPNKAIELLEECSKKPKLESDMSQSITAAIKRLRAPATEKPK